MKFLFGADFLPLRANCAAAARCSTLDGSLHDDNAAVMTMKRTGVYSNGRFSQC